MSYRLDLDEYDEETLQGEIDRRKALRALGKCDYCRYKPTAEKPGGCKFPHRHSVALKELT